MPTAGFLGLMMAHLVLGAVEKGLYGLVAHKGNHNRYAKTGQRISICLQANGLKSVL
jgi:hypothetical protein